MLLLAGKVIIEVIMTNSRADISRAFQQQLLSQAITVTSSEVLYKPLLLLVITVTNHRDNQLLSLAVLLLEQFFY